MNATIPPSSRRRSTLALGLLLSIRAVTRMTDRLCYLLGYIGGVGQLLLAFFITYQVTVQNLDWAHIRGTDSISGYVLALAATWDLAYSLRSGAQVRIDMLLPYMKPAIRAIAAWVALLAIAFFSGVTAWKMWGNVIDNFERRVVATAYLLVPLNIPKAAVATELTLPVVTQTK